MDLFSNDNNFLDNNWYHFALTIEYGTNIINSESEYNVFINGNVVINESLPYPKLGNRTTNYIGKSNYGDNYFTNGNIRDFRIYNRTLEKKEIMKIKNLYKNISLYRDPNTGYLNIGI